MDVQSQRRNQYSKEQPAKTKLLDLVLEAGAEDLETTMARPGTLSLLLNRLKP